MKIGLLQTAPKIGDVRGNLNELLGLIESVKDVDLFVTPELALLGYPPRDLLSIPSYLLAEAQALEKLVNLSAEKSFSILIGHTSKNSGPGKGLFNSASLISEGKILRTVHKNRNASYDIFEEDRFFDSWAGAHTAPINFRGKNIAFAICEDSWDVVSSFGIRDIRRYPRESNPFSTASDVDFFVNLSASPFNLAKVQKREALFTALSGRRGRPAFYCNQATANDDLIFDGHSFAVGADGSLRARAPGFRAGVLIVTMENHDLLESHFQEKNSEAEPAPPLSFPAKLQSEEATHWENLYQALKLGICSYVSKTGHTKILLGLSGGIDSTLVATLATHALGSGAVLGVSLPSSLTSPLSKAEAARVAQNLGIAFREIPIAPMVDAFQKSLGLHATGLPFENLQARVRGVTLMALSNLSGALLLATGNKSELAMGYSTLYGDLCGGLLPLGDLYKTEVYGLAHYINLRESLAGRPAPIPPDSLFRAPTAELAEDQKDSDSLPPYEILDTVLFEIIENCAHMHFSEGDINELLAPYRSSLSLVQKKLAQAEFKRRQSAPILKVHQRSFGSGWKMPLAKEIL